MAKLKLTVDGDLPEYLKDFVTEAEDGEGFELDTEKVKDLPKMGEFRENNRKLFNERQKLNTDLEAATGRIAELEGQLEGDKKKGDKDKNDLETRLKALEESNAAKDEALQKERKRADKAKIKSDLSEALLGAGVKDKALPLALRGAMDGWQVSEDGEGVQLYSGDDLVLSKENAGEPMGLDEFATGFLRENPFLGAESSGDSTNTSTFKKGANGKYTIRGDHPNFAQEWGRLVTAHGEANVEVLD